MAFGTQGLPQHTSNAPDPLMWRTGCDAMPWHRRLDGSAWGNVAGACVPRAPAHNVPSHGDINGKGMGGQQGRKRASSVVWSIGHHGGRGPEEFPTGLKEGVRKGWWVDAQAHLSTATKNSAVC